MKRFKVFLFAMLILFLACNQKQNELCYEYDMIQLLNTDSENQIIQIRDHINDKLYNKSETLGQKFIEYDSITNTYVKLLDKIIEDLKPVDSDYNSSVLSSGEKIEDYFFDNDQYSPIAINYIEKTNEYRDKILSLTGNYFIESRINLALNTSDIIGPNNISFSHLEYYLKDMSLASTMAYFNNHKRKVLELENLYLYQSLIDNKN
ncbi:hypothetical protein [Winogradskyella sp.]|uniref:hypothetical protein n=1 Tax=Winogradskyella sp. TaxID=1883156 RepID=UPI0026231B83|nr:hypothetical protein [Winogradskyella sp.]